MKTEKIMQHLIGKSYADVVSMLSIEEGHGDCCGYASCEVSDMVAQLEGSSDAVLADVVKIEYDNYSEEDRAVVNFIFDLGDMRGVILGYELYASSASGWAYGAYCTLKLGDKEVASVRW